VVLADDTRPRVLAWENNDLGTVPGALGTEAVLALRLQDLDTRRVLAAGGLLSGLEVSKA
jgi:hypothetical protein